MFIRVGGELMVPRESRDENSELVTDPVRVAGLLQNLRAARSLLSVRISSGGAWFNSAIVKVDPEAGVVCLDELTPEEGHLRVGPGTHLRVVGLLQGVPVQFDLVVQKVGSAEGIAFYLAPLPELVDYQQRRSLFRAHVPRQKTLRARLRNEQGQTLTVQLLDVSLGGFGAIMPSFPPLLPLEKIEVESLELPGGEVISGSAEVRYIQDDHDPRRVRAGALFVNLHPQMQRVLLRAILSLEREQIRRQSRS